MGYYATYFYKDGGRWNGNIEHKYPPHSYEDSKRILHREDGPAEIEESYWKITGVSYYLDGQYLGSGKDFRKLFKRIMNYKRESSLNDYLHDNDLGIRYIAEYRLRQLVKEKITSIFNSKDLLEYLLNDDEKIREWSSKRLKELEESFS